MLGLHKLALWRTRRVLESRLSQASVRRSVPQLGDRAAWLESAATVEDLWKTCTCPQWAIHLAHVTGKPWRTIMGAGTRAFAQGLGGFESVLPRVSDPYDDGGRSQPMSHYLERWSELSEEELSVALTRYQDTAGAWLEEETLRRALAQVEASPFRRDAPSDPTDGTRGLLVVAAFYWLLAAFHAGGRSPRRDEICEALAQALALLFAIRPGQQPTLIVSLVVGLTRAGGS